jgi:hypothetical protein
MKLEYKDIIDKHKGKPCVVALHGPSLSPHVDKIQALQREDKIIRISVNEWFDFFEEKPDYWVISNSELNIRDSVLNENIWKSRGYPADVFNVQGVPLLYNRTADLTDPDFVDKNLKCDYLPFDNRHFKGHKCLDILKNFKKYHDENKNLDFKMYGNNAQMWQLPDTRNVNPHCAQVHGVVAGGWSRFGKCCHLMQETTIQEKLQEITGHSQHMGVGQTVGLFCVMFAVIMGCNPIYVTGLDLDYTLGYAEGADKPYYVPNPGNVGHWRHVFQDFLTDDMRILRESAEIKNIEIINLNKNAWYDVFKKGDLGL